MRGQWRQVASRVWERKVIDFSQRTPDLSGVQAVKRRVTPYECIVVEQPEGLTEEVCVSLHLAGHDPKGNVEALAAEKGTAAVHIQGTSTP